MKAANWYDPIRKSIAYLNEHVAENVSVERLVGKTPNRYRQEQLGR